MLSAACAPSGTHRCCCREQLHPGSTQVSGNCPCKEIIVYPLTYRAITYLSSLGFILGIMLNPVFLREIGLFSESSSLLTSLSELLRQKIRSDFWSLGIRLRQLTGIWWFLHEFIWWCQSFSQQANVSQGCRSGFFFFCHHKFLLVCLQLFIVSFGNHHCWWKTSDESYV